MTYVKATSTILNATEIQENEGSFMTPFYIASNAICIGISIFTVLLNTFVLWGISRKERVWDVSYAFLWHLSLVDALNGMLLLYNVIFNFAYFQNFYECLFRFGCVHGVKVLSGYLLLGIGLERYIRIVFPYKYWRILSEKNVRAYISSAWVSAILFALVPLFSWINNIPEHDFCQYFSVLKPEVIWSFCFLMILAFLCQCVIYSHIFVIARRAWTSAPKGALKQGSSIALWWKPTKVILFILGTNLLTQGPVGAYLITVSSGAFKDWDVITKGVTLTYIATPGYVSSMINPLLYAFRVPDIRDAFDAKFCYCCTRNKIHDTHFVSEVNRNNFQVHQNSIKYSHDTVEIFHI